MALWSTHVCIRTEYEECYVRDKGGLRVGQTTKPPSCADCLEIWESQPPGTLRACPGIALQCFTSFGLCSGNHQTAYLIHIQNGPKNVYTLYSSISLE